MKAISVRQPWADLIIQGKMTLNLRSRSTKYRGHLAIYASQTIEKDACERFGIDPDLLTAGAVIGMV
jgi:activating signal cointegrator 1